MGRKKLEMKRIEDTSSRLVSFSKRRSGLVKKARHLSILCDVDVAVVVFSDRGKLYEFSSDKTNSVEGIISRYKETCLERGETTTKGAGDLCKRFQTCKDLLETVGRLMGENNPEELSVDDMTQLEQELDATLVQTRLRKTQLMMEYLSALQEKVTNLTQENEDLEKQTVRFLIRCPLKIANNFKFEVASSSAAAAEENIDFDDGGGGLNNLATNQINSPQLITLPLFKG